MENASILIVDDEKAIVDMIKRVLEKEGYRNILDAASAEEAIPVVKANKVDLIVLDVMMGGMSGFEACTLIREYSDAPIFFLTARSSDADKLSGFAVGADDYITKPFSVKEVLARITSVLRRYKYTSNEKVEVLKADDIQVNVNKHIVTKNGTEIELTLKEFQILKLLIENRGNVLTRTFLLDKIWGYDYYGETRTLDVHIRNLRKKIGDDDAKYIETIRGVGYKIK